MSWLDASWGGRWAGEACSTVAVVTGPPAAHNNIRLTLTSSRRYYGFSSDTMLGLPDGQFAINKLHYFIMISIIWRGNRNS